MMQTTGQPIREGPRGGEGYFRNDHRQEGEKNRSEVEVAENGGMGTLELRSRGPRLGRQWMRVGTGSFRASERSA